jgi:N-acylneuraminate cytidylyltransferase
MQNVVCIIPARGGSKGIPRKNVIDFCGKPLLAWSIRQGIEALGQGRVYVSTDNEEIAAVSREFGANVIVRPNEISGDTASSESALVHAITEIENQRDFTTVVFLQATSPLRFSSDLSGALEAFERDAADSLFSATKTEDFCLWKRDAGGMHSFSFDYKNRGRRQDREPLYLENGSLYIFKKDVIREFSNRLGGKISTFEMPFWQSYEIDSPGDIDICEYFMRRNILK